MLDYFEKDGVSSLEYGVHVETLPPITIPKERVKFEDVLGRSGSLAMVEGECVYDDLTLAADCWIEDTEALAELAVWLRGEGRLMFPNREGGYYIGRLANQIELERILRGREHRRFTLTWRCRPFFYLDEAREITITKQQDQINNLGSVPSEPRMTIYGTGSFFVTLGDQQMEFTGVADGIIVDTELLDALSLDGAQLLNDRVTGDFFTIPPGRSPISWTGGGLDGSPGSVTKIVIAPRWRTL